MEKDIVIKNENDLPLVYKEMILTCQLEWFFKHKLFFSSSEYQKVIINIKDENIIISVPVNKTEYKTINIPYKEDVSILDNLYLETLGLKPFKEDTVKVEEEFFNN